MEEWKSSDGGRIRSDTNADVVRHIPDPVELDHPLRMMRGTRADATKEAENENGTNLTRGEEDFTLQDLIDGAPKMEEEKSIDEEMFDKDYTSKSRCGSGDTGIFSRYSGASSRVHLHAWEERNKRKETLSPGDKLLDDARTPGGYLRLSFKNRSASKVYPGYSSLKAFLQRNSKDNKVSEEGTAGETVQHLSHRPSYFVHKEVPCKPIGRGWGLPLASLVDQNIEEALQGGARTPDNLQYFGHDQDLLPMVWEIVSLLVVGSIIYALWVYQGRSTMAVDLITVALSSTGAVGIIARAFTARNYCGVVYNSQLASGIVDLPVFSIGEIYNLAIGLSGIYAKAFLLVAGLPALIVVTLASIFHIVRFVYNLVLPRGSNSSWVLGRGMIRFRTRLAVVPLIEKRVVRGGVGSNLSTIQWPGGAWRNYYGDPMDGGSWALHFSGRRSFWDEMACDKMFVQFGDERRLVIQTGRRILSFVIAARDDQGGLLLIPVEASAGVRVRLTRPAFSEAIGGVTILMGVEYPKQALSPEEELARDLNLQAEPFCLDVSACGTGEIWKEWAAMFNVLDGAGSGSVSDESILWSSLSKMCFPSPASSWAAGFFGGNFSELHEQAADGGITTYTGMPGHGKRCVTLIPTDKKSRLTTDYDVVVGVVAREQGFVRVPVYQPDGISIQTGFDGIRGRFSLIPGGFHGKWCRRWDGNIKGRERLGDCDECLLYNTSDDRDDVVGRREAEDKILPPLVPTISVGVITAPPPLPGIERASSVPPLYPGTASLRGGPSRTPSTQSLH